MTGAEIVVAVIIGLVALGLYLRDVGDDPAPQYSRLDRLDGLGKAAVIPLNAVCTCKHTLAEHGENSPYCFTLLGDTLESVCPCKQFLWDNGKVR